MRKEHIFKLNNPIEITVNGKFETVYELVLKSPNMTCRAELTRLQQMFSRAEADFEKNFIQTFGAEMIMELQKNKPEIIEPDENEGKNTAEVLKNKMEQSGQDLDVFYKAFDKLFTKVALVTPDTYLREEHISLFDFKDYKKMCYEYMSNFII